MRVNNTFRKLKKTLSFRFGEAALFNLHYLYFNYHLRAQKFLSLWKILL